MTKKQQQRTAVVAYTFLTVITVLFLELAASIFFEHAADFLGTSLIVGVVAMFLVSIWAYGSDCAA
jgi:hypothetical protein